MELDHFSHEHPLQLIDELQRDDDGDEEFLCDGCRKPIILGGSSVYTCKECKYVLHKKCAELPKEIKHPMHLQHSLTLFSNPPYQGSECECNICRIEWKWFTYHCSVCEFDVHISCALEEDVIKHESHHHQLSFVQRSSTFFCDACDTEDKDLSYRCTTCPFWIHKTCAKLPSTITRNDDKHPLVLTYSLPNIYRKFKPTCQICRKKLNPSYWIYYCELCRYFAHLKCATVEKEPLRGAESSSTAEAYLDPNLMNFPLPDNSMDVVISRFVKSISVEAVNDVARELIHFSHEQHPLILFDDLLSDDGMINKEIQCDGCVQPISVPFYTCRSCNFFLHKCCAELPEQILQHPSHPEHPLSLSMLCLFFLTFSIAIAAKHILKDLAFGVRNAISSLMSSVPTVQKQSTMMLTITTLSNSKLNIPSTHATPPELFLVESDIDVKLVISISQTTVPTCHEQLSMNGIVTHSCCHIPLSATIQMNLFVKFARKI